MIDILAVALKGWKDLLFAEMKGVSPVDVPILEQTNIGIAAVVFLFEDAIIEAGIDHE